MRKCLYAAALVLLPTTAQAEQDNGNFVETLTGCRSVTDPAARLACFDQAAAALESAREKREIVILDHSEVKKTRRSLFGFALPRIKFLEGDGKEEAETQIETTIEAARSLGYGKWSLRTTEGATWQTTEALLGAPRSGGKLSIKQGSLGGYFLKAAGERAVRAIRVN